PDANLAVAHGELADDAGLLRGEPRIALAVERHRVRILDRWIRHHVVRRLSGGRIEPNDSAVRVSCEPDDALRVHDEVVRMRSLLDRVPLEVTLLGIEIRDKVSLLADEPHAAALIREGIAGSSVFVERGGPRLRFRTKCAGLTWIGLRGHTDGRDEEQQCD